jgi:CRP/FNR family transcriptional regulator, polysaccharide utilization system transcription regulator
LAKYSVITAFNGKVGVTMAQENKPDLIICDVMMPELDGFGVLHLLRKEKSTADIPFIFLTAKDEKQELRKGMNLGADDYITKPFDGLELLNAVEMRLMKTRLLTVDFQSGPDGIEQFFKEAKKLREFNNLANHRVSKRIKKRDMVYIEGQQQSEMFYVKTGQIKTYKTNQDGKDLTLAFYNPGNFFGYVSLLENSTSSESAIATEETELYTIPKQDFLTMIYTNREIARKFIKMLANNLHEAEERLLQLAYQSVRQKVAGALLKIYRQYAPTKSHRLITISRKDLSTMIGTATESLNRTLADFKEEGLIDVKEDGIVILNSRTIADMLI